MRKDIYQFIATVSFTFACITSRNYGFDTETAEYCGCFVIESLAYIIPIIIFAGLSKLMANIKIFNIPKIQSIRV